MADQESLPLGTAGLASLLAKDGFTQEPLRRVGGLPELPHFAPKAKRVIFLHQSGGPSQLETFDYKPALAKFQGTQIPDSVRQGQRVAPCRRQSEPPQSPSYLRRGSADSCLASAIKSPCGVSVEAVAIEVTAFGP